MAGKPIAIATWKGRDESLESILLNSHMDVVPAVLVRFSHTHTYLRLPTFLSFRSTGSGILLQRRQRMASYMPVAPKVPWLQLSFGLCSRLARYEVCRNSAPRGIHSQMIFRMSPSLPPPCPPPSLMPTSGSHCVLYYQQYY